MLHTLFSTLFCMKCKIKIDLIKDFREAQENYAIQECSGRMWYRLCSSLSDPCISTVFFFIKIGMLDTRYLYLQNKTNKKLIVFDEKQSGIQMQNGVRYGMGQQTDEFSHPALNRSNNKWHHRKRRLILFSRSFATLWFWTVQSKINVFDWDAIWRVFFV